MKPVFHALGLHFHQPLGNLAELDRSEKERWEARQILWCYDRPTRLVEGWEDVARLHFSFSGTLLKQFEDQGVAETFAGVANIPEIVERYRRGPFEITGSGLYHPVYPLTPEADWDDQTGWWLGLGRHLFGRGRFQGFWPPEMGFCMEMIPMLARHGYRYVLVDSMYIKPRRPMRWEEIRYQPHIARFGGAEIIVIPRDRELSDAQLSGMEPGWFENEVVQRTRWCDFPALVTTWTDGDNGGWFRTTNLDSGFWGRFMMPTLQRARAGELAYRPIHIPEFLDRFPVTSEVDVHRGAWNTGDHWGGDFTQWTGSLLQKRGWDELRNASAYYHRLAGEVARAGGGVRDAERTRGLVAEAHDCILRAETSCNFYWGSAWVGRSFEDIERAYRLLDEAAKGLPAPARAAEDAAQAAADPAGPAAAAGTGTAVAPPPGPVGANTGE